MVAIGPGDDVFLFRFALQDEVMVDHPHGAVVGVGAAAGEEHVVQVARRHAGQFCRQFHRRRRRAIAEMVHLGQLARLFGNGLGQFRVAVADVHRPQPAVGIQVTVAVRIEDISAFAFDEYATALFPEAGPDALRVDQVILVLLPQVPGIETVEFGIVRLVHWQRPTLIISFILYNKIIK